MDSNYLFWRAAGGQERCMRAEAEEHAAVLKSVGAVLKSWGEHEKDNEQDSEEEAEEEPEGLESTGRLPWRRAACSKSSRRCSSRTICSS